MTDTPRHEEPDAAPDAQLQARVIPLRSGERLPAVPDDGELEVREVPDREIEVRVPGEVDRPAEADQPGEGEAVPWRQPPTRRPVIAAWIVQPDERRQAGRWFVLYVGHKSVFHLVRAPVYLVRVLAYAPRGVVRGVVAWVQWAFDLEGFPLRRHAIEKADISGYMQLTRVRNDRVRLRLQVSGGLAVAGLVTFGSAAAFSDVVFYLLCAVGAVAAGWYGRRKDQPLIPPAVISSPEAQRLTPDVVIRALASLGIAAINQAVAKGPGITFAAPITRDGPGWRADIDLPYGVTVTDVMDRRDRLASGLRRPLGCVWPSSAPGEHEGRLVLWVGDRDLSKTRQPAWPLAKTGTVDLFKPFPFGTDQRGQPVTLTLMFASMVIGAVPRMGKTFAARLVLLASALDPRAQLHVYDLKGTGDFSTLEPVAHRYRAGDDDDDIEYAVADMRALQAELRRRTKVIRGLPRDLCPENKVTPQLAGTKSLGLHPIVLAVDECQRWFEHPEHGGELTGICEDLVRRGPAVGIVAVFATQRPDAKSIPTGISGNAILRFCLKVMDQIANDQVLGTSSYKAGIRATIFTRRDLGIGWLVGEGEDPAIVRSFYVDNPGAERIVARARALREQAGTLSGHACGEIEAGPKVSLIADVAAIWPAGEDKAWSETLCARLAELRPQLYGGWTPAQLAEALKPHGVETSQVWGRTETGESANRRGITHADVLAAQGRQRNRAP